MGAIVNLDHASHWYHYFAGAAGPICKVRWARPEGGDDGVQRDPWFPWGDGAPGELQRSQLHFTQVYLYTYINQLWIHARTLSEWF